MSCVGWDSVKCVHTLDTHNWTRVNFVQMHLRFSESTAWLITFCSLNQSSKLNPPINPFINTLRNTSWKYKRTCCSKYHSTFSTIWNKKGYHYFQISIHNQKYYFVILLCTCTHIHNAEARHIYSSKFIITSHRSRNETKPILYTSTTTHQEKIWKNNYLLNKTCLWT